MSSPFIVINEISQKLNEINSSISNTLSTINTNVNNVKTDLSNVKTICDNIYSKVDTEIASLLTNTNTNNTANLTGTLSQKLSYIANNLVGAVNQIGGTYNTGTVNAKLATILLNMETTTFTAGTSIIKYNPITSETIFSADGDKLVYYNGKADFWISNKAGQYSFKSNRDGTVLITISTTNRYGCNRFVVTNTPLSNVNKYDHIDGLVEYFHNSNIDNITETIELNVKKGNTYYLDFLLCSTGYTVDCEQLKVSYNININTSTL